MSATKAIAAPEFFTWTFPGAPLKIDLSLIAVERLKQEVLDAGDQETGGILLGHVVPASPIVVRITDFQPAPLEGRSLYALKGTERRAFMQTVASFRVPGREMAVGYYRSHLRDGLSLDHQDLTLVQTCLPGPTDVVLLIRPEPDGAITAGFFFWDEGHINPDASFLEFPLDAGQLRWQIARPRPAAAGGASGGLRKGGFGTGVIVGGLGTVLLGAAFLVGRFWQPSPSRTAASLTPVSEMAAERSSPGTSGLGAVPLRNDALLDQTIAPGALNYDLESARIRSDQRRGASRSRRSAMGRNDAPLDDAGAAAETEPANSSPEPQSAQPSPRQFEPPAAVRKPRGDASMEPPSVPAATQTASAAVHPEPLLGNAPPAPQPPPVKEPQPAPVRETAPVKETAAAQVPPSEPYIAPQPVAQVQPVVPTALRSMLFRPTQVQIKVKVDENGAVVAAEPGKSKDALGNVLSGLAVDAARRWRFKPALRNSRPVAGDAVISFNFVPPKR